MAVERPGERAARGCSALDHGREVEPLLLHLGEREPRQVVRGDGRDDAHPQRLSVPVVAREELRLPLAVPLRLRLAALRAGELVEDADVLAEEERARGVPPGLALDRDRLPVRGPRDPLLHLHEHLSGLRLEAHDELRVRRLEQAQDLVGLLGRRIRLELEAFVLADLGRGRGDAAEEEDRPSEHDPYATLPATHARQGPLVRPVPAGTPVARTLPLVARYTWALQWPSAALEGLAAGVVGLSAFVVERSLGAPEEAVPVLIALWQLVWVFAPGIGTLLARADPQRLWRTLALATFLPLAGVAFVVITPTSPGHGKGTLWLFLALMALHYGSAIATVPHRGALLRTNYPQHVRGRMFGLFMVANLLAAGAAAKGAGYLLDWDPRCVRVIYPLAAVSGIAAFLLMGRIRWRRSREARRLAAHASDGVVKAMTNAWRETFRILREDKAFGTYERGFMLYGLGFLSSVGLLVLYSEKVLGLSYAKWTWAQSVAFPLAQIAGAALFGRLSDRLGVVRTTAVSFFLLCGFFALMPFVHSATHLAAAYVLWGVAMGGVNVGWSLGPLHFAPDGEAHMYGAVHFCLVGIRSLIGPFLGYAMKELFGYTAAFALSAALVAAGGVTAWRLGSPSRPGVS